MKMEKEPLPAEKKTTFVMGTSSIIIAVLTYLGGGLDAFRDNHEIRWFLVIASAVLFYKMVTLCFRENESEEIANHYQAFNKICVVISAVLILISLAGIMGAGAGSNGALAEGTETVSGTGQPETPAPTPAPSIDPAGKIAAGEDFTLLLQSDGKVACIGDAKGIDTSGWSDIVQIAAYNDHAIGLCESGHVVTTGGAPGEYDAGDWWGIKQVAACAGGVIGVTPRGAVWFAGTEGNTLMACTYWENIDRILGGEKHIVALAKNGEVLALGENRYGALNTEDFSGVIAGAAANDSTFVVFSDGTAAQAGRDWSGEDKVSGWSQLVAIAGGLLHTAGLRDDGTVVCSGDDEDGQCDVKEWKDVVAICAGQYHTVGLCADGSLVATGCDASGQCDVSGVNYWVEN